MHDGNGRVMFKFKHVFLALLLISVVGVAVIGFIDLSPPPTGAQQTLTLD